MLIIKTKKELSAMADAGKIAAQALVVAGEAIKVGVSTGEVNLKIHNFLVKSGAKPSFLGYGGFPASACISINDTVIHGIPSKHEIIKEGDIVSVDVGAYYRGFHGDNAKTFMVGAVSDEARKLVLTTELCFENALKAIVPGARIGDIGSAVQTTAEEAGFSVVRDFIGHGVGASLHEEPEVPNYGVAGRGQRLLPGMTIAIEPMINEGKPGVEILSDKWTVKTLDRKLSSHHEKTIAVTDTGYILLTDI